jgi:hypothetical protein
VDHLVGDFGKVGAGDDVVHFPLAGDDLLRRVGLEGALRGRFMHPTPDPDGDAPSPNLLRISNEFKVEITPHGSASSAPLPQADD